MIAVATSDPLAMVAALAEEGSTSPRDNIRFSWHATTWRRMSKRRSPDWNGTLISSSTKALVQSSPKANEGGRRASAKSNIDLLELAPILTG